MRPLSPQRRWQLAAVAALLLSPFLLIGLLVVLAESPWTERWIEARVGKQLDREVEISEIKLRLGLPMGIELGRLRISNPEWAQAKNLVDATAVKAKVELAPLFSRRFVVPYLEAAKATAGLERSGTRATWRFNDKDAEGSRIKLARIQLRDGDIAFRDDSEKTALEFKVKGGLGEKDALEFTGTGSLRGEAARATGRIPSLEPTPGLDIPIVADVSIGRTNVSAEGTIAPDLKAFDFRFRLAGDTLHDLRTLFGMNLPDTPPYRLAGTLKHSGQEWIFSPLEGKVGDSDIRGEATYRRGGERPMFVAQLQSNLLDLDDLGPMIGLPPKTGPGQTASAAQRAQSVARKRTPKVIPRARFETKRWKEMDADVTLVAKRVQRPAQLPLDTFSMHVFMNDSVLRLEPLAFGVAGGRIAAKVVVNGKNQPARGTLDVDVQGMQLAKLFPAAESMDASFGTLYGRGTLAGTGESVGALLESSNGQLSLAIDSGRVSALLVELLGLDFGEALMMLGTRNKQVELRCAVGTFNIASGVAMPESFVVDTSDTVVRIEGQVDMKRERLDLITYPEPKDQSILALRSPIRIQGTLRNPTVSPDAGSLLTRGAVAIGLGAINPMLALLALIETGPGKDTDCVQLLQEARTKGAVKKSL